jgi:acetamidase/formamidase
MLSRPSTPALAALLLVLSVLAPAVSSAQPGGVAGDWVFMFYERGELLMAARGKLAVTDGAVAGNAGSLAIRGSLKETDLALEWVGGNGKVAVSLKGTAEKDRLAGTAEDPDGLTYTWTAERDAGRPAEPKTHRFTPEVYQKYFSAKAAPVLRVRAGDSIVTTSLDAGGADENGRKKWRGGNPVTGPFYVEGALPGDTLAVKLKRIRTNRGWADSGTQVVGNAVAPDYTANLRRARGLGGRWKLDPAGGTASVAGDSQALKDLRVPLRPMLGVVAVAPFRQEVANTRASGPFGGNMDYNRLREGTTVYLPVFHPGALLFLGDAHAAQGDGELAGDALETSMEFEVTVDVIRDLAIDGPYAEDGESWMVLGIAGSLEEALRQATTRTARYLEEEHGLNSTEAALVLGSSMHYDVADVVGEQVSIVGRLPKTLLDQLPKRKHAF